MQVLHVIAGLRVGGAEHMLRRLVLEDRAASGTRHVVVSLTDEGPVGAMLAAAGVEVHALGMRSVLSAPRALWRLRALIARRRPNVVQTWMYHADLIGGIAARLAGVHRVIWGVRASELVKGVPRTTFAIRWLCARLSSRVPAVIVCAAEHARRVHAALGYDDTRMRTIPNGFATDVPVLGSPATAEARRALGLTPGEVVVGTVGRFDPFKDFGNFVRAAGRIHRARAAGAPSVRFVMIGAGLDAENAELADWARQAGVEAQLLLLGARSDVAALLPAMDVFVLPSRSEGFPNVVGEAMAAGVACVVTDVGDAARLVGGAGLVVPREDDAALAAAVQGLIDAPEERAALGLAARRRIVEEFSMARTRERFAALYRELVERTKETGPAARGAAVKA